MKLWPGILRHFHKILRLKMMILFFNGIKKANIGNIDLKFKN